MKRKLLILGLSAGTVLGFGHGFSHLARCHQGHADRRAAFEDHVADVCVDAANRANDRSADYAVYQAPVRAAAPMRQPPILQAAQGCDSQWDAPDFEPRDDDWMDAQDNRRAHAERRHHRRHRRHRRRHPRRPHDRSPGQAAPHAP